MAKIERQADAIWEGDLVHGKGRFTLSSGVLKDQPVTWAARTENPGGKTSPEELIAAAHASCYAMALSHTLAQAGTPPQQLSVIAVCGLEQVEGGFKITSMQLEVSGKVPGLDAKGFEEVTQKAEQGCPVSNALRNNVQIHLKARLEP